MSEKAVTGVSDLIDSAQPRKRARLGEMTLLRRRIAIQQAGVDDSMANSSASASRFCLPYSVTGRGVSSRGCLAFVPSYT